MAKQHIGADQLVGQNLEQAYKMAQNNRTQKASHGKKCSLLILEQKYKDIKDRLRDDFNAQRALEYQQKRGKLRKRQKLNKVLRIGALVIVFATTTTGVVLTAGAGFGLYGFMPTSAKWVRSWSKKDKKKKERLRAEYDPADERGFAQYLKNHGLNKEDVAELLSTNNCDSSSDDNCDSGSGDNCDSGSEDPQPRKWFCF